MTVQDWSNAMDIKELQNIMQENGVVGAGGAGFPTYMKLTDKAEYHSYELCRVRTFTETYTDSCWRSTHTRS